MQVKEEQKASEAINMSGMRQSRKTGKAERVTASHNNSSIQREDIMKELEEYVKDQKNKYLDDLSDFDVASNNAPDKDLIIKQDNSNDKSFKQRKSKKYAAEKKQADVNDLCD